MNLAEFKAWFDGYTEDMKDAPSKKQWERIKARVAEIDGKPITQTIYLDRYVRPYWHDYYGGILNTNVGYNAQTKGAAGLSVASSLVGQNAAELSKAASAQFDSQNAMYAAGKAEAQAA